MAEDRKILAFARETPLSQLPDTVVMLPECLTPSETEVPQEANMEAALARLPPGTPRLISYTTSPERASVSLLLISPLYLVHPLMVSSSMSPSNACHMMHAKAEAMGIT